MRTAIFWSMLVGFASAANADKATAAEITEADKAGAAVAEPIADFRLPDSEGQDRSFSEYVGNRIAVVAFLGCECPLARSYAPKLDELSRSLPQDKVRILAINSNHQDTPEKIAHLVAEYGLTFPTWIDANQQVADLFGAKRNPEFFVLDRERRVRYHGRMDDQFGLGERAAYAKEKPTREDLALAVGELLAGKEVTIPRTEATGCLIGRTAKRDAPSDVTYSNRIAAILNARCVICHREGDIGPFALDQYDEVAGWGPMIEEVVSDRRMPPWHANPEYGSFKNDARLSDEEVTAIQTWVAAGCPEGNPEELPPPPNFVEGWQMGTPDEVFTMPEPYPVPPSGIIDYRYFVVDPGFTEDKWISAIELKAGNRKVVHHIILFLSRTGEKRDWNDGQSLRAMLHILVPGAGPLVLPEGVAKRIPAGHKLIFQLHYTTCGTPELDQSSVGFKYADPSTVKAELRNRPVPNITIKIPPYEGNYRSTSHHYFRSDTLMHSLFPHMHVRGKAFRILMHYPDGRSEILLDVPKYDFNWQHTYWFTEPMMVSKGSRLECIGWFDNSPENPANPDPSKTVRWGHQTSDEMMIGFFDATIVGADPMAADAEPDARSGDESRRRRSFLFPRGRSQ